MGVGCAKICVSPLMSILSVCAPGVVKVNNIPQVSTQSDFRALIKAQNIPHPSYDIDGDGVVSQEDYALAKVSKTKWFPPGRAVLVDTFDPNQPTPGWIWWSPTKECI